MTSEWQALKFLPGSPLFCPRGNSAVWGELILVDKGVGKEVSWVAGGGGQDGGCGGAVQEFVSRRSGGRGSEAAEDGGGGRRRNLGDVQGVGADQGAGGVVLVEVVAADGEVGVQARATADAGNLGARGVEQLGAGKGLPPV